MRPYRHTQIAYAVLVSLALTMILVAIDLRASLPLAARAIILGLVSLIGVIFSSLTVELRDNALRIWFGPGFPRWRWPLQGIASARSVRNPWYAGWGIHWVGYWIFNVSGWRAVEVGLVGGRKFRIGTDEPEALLNALRNAGVRMETTKPSAV